MDRIINSGPDVHTATLSLDGPEEQRDASCAVGAVGAIGTAHVLDGNVSSTWRPAQEQQQEVVEHEPSQSQNQNHWPNYKQRSEVPAPPSQNQVLSPLSASSEPALGRAPGPAQDATLASLAVAHASSGLGNGANGGGGGGDGRTAKTGSAASNGAATEARRKHTKSHGGTE
jgi:hypothetical protein